MKVKRKRQNAHLPTILTALLCTLAAISAVILIIYSGSENGDIGSSDVPAVTSPVITYFGTDIPVAGTADVNEYDNSLFVYDAATGYISYNSPGATCGIDVSAHQDEIDWQAVADAGIKFAMIRIGYRGYTVGNISLDSFYAANIEGATAAGIKVGVYFYSQAISVQEAEEEADFVLENIKGYTVTYPIVYDWELIEEEGSRSAAVDRSQLTSFATAFCDKIASAGYTPMIYFNTAIGYLYYDFNKVSGYDLWLAEYDKTPSFYYSFDMWQYSCTGTVPGISADVDLNISFTSFG